MTNTRIALYALVLAFTTVAGCSSSKNKPDENAYAPVQTSAPADTNANTNTDTLDLGASSAGRAR
jgi:predicted component of type VI protein secretion system